MVYIVWEQGDDGWYLIRVFAEKSKAEELVLQLIRGGESTYPPMAHAFGGRVTMRGVREDGSQWRVVETEVER